MVLQRIRRVIPGPFAGDISNKNFQWVVSTLNLVVWLAQSVELTHLLSGFRRLRLCNPGLYERSNIMLTLSSYINISRCGHLSDP